MLSIRNVSRSFAGLQVLRDIDLDVATGEIVCLLGPSGCGKTTLLRIIAGLETADSGDILLGEASISHVPVHQRGFGLMFQDFALFPHMNVLDNVLFGLRMQHVPAQESRDRAAAALALVGLAGFEARDVAQLSGGEQQRVALARSLAPRPQLLMLDEPLGSLDAVLRERLVVELRDIIKQIGLTAVYVTHDQAEAYAISDRIAVMNRGRIEQIDRPQVVYNRPRSEFVARFLGLTNIVPVTRREDGVAHTPVGVFALASQADSILLHPRGIRPAHAVDQPTVSGVVVESVFRGSAYRVVLRHASGVDLTFDLGVTDDDHPLPGAPLTIFVQPSALVPLVRLGDEAH